MSVFLGENQNCILDFGFHINMASAVTATKNIKQILPHTQTQVDSPKCRRFYGMHSVKPIYKMCLLKPIELFWFDPISFIGISNTRRSPYTFFSYSNSTIWPRNLSYRHTHTLTQKTIDLRRGHEYK